MCLDALNYIVLFGCSIGDSSCRSSNRVVLIVQLSMFVSPSSQENATKAAGMVSSFCNHMGWADLEHLVAKFQGVCHHPI